MSSTVPVGALVGWMLLLTAKHIVADFFLQNSWMAIGKDQKTGWALPLLAHCLVHLAVALPLILIVAPKFWFVAFIDFFIHITVDRAKGLCHLALRRQPGASLVLVADRRRSGAASSDRFRAFDLHGGQLGPAVSGIPVADEHALMVRPDIAFDHGPAQPFVKPVIRGRAQR